MEVSFLSSIFLSSALVAGGGVWAPTSPALANTNATPTIAASALFTVTPPGVWYAGGTPWAGPSAVLPSCNKIREQCLNTTWSTGPRVDPGSVTMVKMTKPIYGEPNPCLSDGAEPVGSDRPRGRPSCGR